jgi:hypothetical protein
MKRLKKKICKKSGAIRKIMLFLPGILLLSILASRVLLNAYSSVDPFPEHTTGIKDSCREHSMTQRRTLNLHSRTSRIPSPSDFPQQITYLIFERSNVTVRILDEKERSVREFDRGLQHPGKYRILWDGRDDSGNRVSGMSFSVELTLKLYPIQK